MEYGYPTQHLNMSGHHTCLFGVHYLKGHKLYRHRPEFEPLGHHGTLSKGFTSLYTMSFFTYNIRMMIRASVQSCMKEENEISMCKALRKAPGCGKPSTDNYHDLPVLLSV